MPDLPEIEVLRRDLEKEVVTRRIKDVEVRNTRNAMKAIRRHGRRKDFQALLEGAKVERVDRVGRRLLFDLDNSNTLVVDLGTSGLLLKTSASDEVVTHTHVTIGFTIGGQLRLVDAKQSSEIYAVPTAETEGLREDIATAIDPLMHQVTWQHFSELLSDRDAAMKELLTDEKFVVGLGDIYSDEVLWSAGLRYDRSSSKLSSQDVRRLYRGLMETLQDAVRARGTSLDEAGFKDLHGDPGQYQLELKVFECEGDACKRCRSTVVKEQFNGRDTYLCAQCQS
ncbi:MAG TPA: bifunctional DNA-formamidopyrimidine glycosylase/DNA-(apurinic or apyrimidinic site) lyase [Actinomycetota bacterium]|nr:bifunctional DNA-formamidopyrimidine glycosylase/DNA-(apurinic or apyrimidinic site) lyase [Actinomycetota bacterium]